MTLNGAWIRRTVFDGFMLAYVAVSAWIAATGVTLERLTTDMKRESLRVFLFVVIGSVMSVLINQQGIATLGEMIFAPLNCRRDSGKTPKAFYQTFWGCELILVFLITIALGSVIADINFVRLLDEDSISQAGRVFRQLLTPDWSVLPQAIIKVIQTVFIAFMATIIAVPIAFILSFLTAKNLMGDTTLGSVTYTTLRALFNLSRSVEPIIWAIVFSVWVSFGPFAGMLALLVHSVASLAKQYSEIVEGVEQGPVEGIEATGAGRLQTIWFAIVPQILLPYLSYTIYRWDTNVRSATILGIVGGGGIGTMLMEYLGQSMWHQVGTIVVVISIVVWLMDAFSAHVRAAIK